MDSLSDLKTFFYKEHVRDRRLTLINYTLILGFIILVLGVLYYIGVDFKQIISDFIHQNGDDNSMTALYPIIATIVDRKSVV